MLFSIKIIFYWYVPNLIINKKFGSENNMIQRLAVFYLNLISSKDTLPEK